MRSTIVLIIGILLHISCISFGQVISLNLKNASLQRAITKIEKKTDYTFFYNDAQLKIAKPINLKTTGQLVNVLNQLFQGQPLTYTIFKKNIIVQDKSSDTTLPLNAATPHMLQEVKGKVIDTEDEPVAGATVVVNGTQIGTKANDKGEFSIVAAEDAILQVSCVGYESQQVPLTADNDITVKLKVRPNELATVEVTLNNGYQEIPKERATGSFGFLDKELVNRRVSTNVIDKLEGLTPGLVFNKNIQPGINQSSMTIRGRSTIFANPNPLIVLDNFPYDGDPLNINPNDIETITILRDAAATSIWGAFSGNGVIVLTSKKGKYDQKTRVSLNSSLTIGNKPDLYYLPALSSRGYIEAEQFLFNNGFYNVIINSPLHPSLSPAAEILIKYKNDPAQATAALNALGEQDVRKDLDQYFYRKSINQQYSLNLAGGSANNRYYTSVGFDKNLENLVRNQYDRITVNASNANVFLKKKLEWNNRITFLQSKRSDNNTGNPGKNFPYLDLVDNNTSTALSVPYFFRQIYVDTAGKGKLHDWNYRPFDEMRLSDNRTSQVEYKLNTEIKYEITKNLGISAQYQYTKGISENENFHSTQTYFTRDLVNKFTQINSQTGEVFRPVPFRGILDQKELTYGSNRLRGQINYNHSWNEELHSIFSLAGAEMTDYNSVASSNRLYGYDKESPNPTRLDHVTLYPYYYYPAITGQIPDNISSFGASDHFISYFANASYAYDRRYILTLSGRKDESNLFGAKINKKAIPLWSAGVSWNISNEKFYKVGWLPYLNLRVTNGFNGNIDKTLSAYVNALFFGRNVYGDPTAIITNPPNPFLSWEKIHTINIGFDFASRKKTIEGSIEFYQKKGKDLIGNSPFAPSTGTSISRVNSANMSGRGIDLMINTKNIRGTISWNSSLLFSYAEDKVTSYKANLSTIDGYLNSGALNPLVGKPLYAIYSLRWAGLDSAGNPRGYLDNKISTNYTAIMSSTDFSSLIYNGPANPPFFGALRNTVSWKQLSFSFNIMYKFGYYFKRPSIFYSELLYGSPGHNDFMNRWKTPGDEAFTNVPSMIYPVNILRDEFYRHSEILVEKGDHIRLKDIQLSYELTKQLIPKLPMQLARLYVYADNVGILWRANDKGIDPDYIGTMPTGRSVAVGLTVIF